MSNCEKLICLSETKLSETSCKSAGQQLFWYLLLRGRNFPGTGRAKEAAFYYGEQELEGLPYTRAIRQILYEMVEVLEPERPVLRVKAILNHPSYKGGFHTDERIGKRVIGTLIGGGVLELAGPARGSQYLNGKLPVQDSIEVSQGSLITIDNTVPFAIDREQHRFVNDSPVRIGLVLGDEVPVVGAYGKKQN